jgi:hypothetical protein
VIAEAFDRLQVQAASCKLCGVDVEVGLPMKVRHGVWIISKASWACCIRVITIAGDLNPWQW